MLLNTRECLSVLSTNANRFKAFKEKYAINAVKAEKNQELYDIKELVKYWVQDAKEKTNQDLDRNSEDARLKKAQADIKELELAKMKGLLLEREDVEKDVAELIVVCKNKLLNLPSSLTDLVSGVEDRQKVNSIIKKHVYEVLEELSRLADVPNQEAKREETIDETPIEAISTAATD